jgi:hypothetical protein
MPFKSTFMPQSFLFIPDISGFTEFVHTTDSAHSRHIISELLEILIDSNILGLELAEVEGDALFFFKANSVPSEEEIIRQAKSMYLAFHNHIKLYEYQRICPCGACETAVNLKLKFVAHSGNLDFIQIKDSSKPYGKVVIQTHRALKNSIPSNEYLLLSDDLRKDMSQTKDPISIDWISGTEQFDFGDFHYKYLEITSWKDKLEKLKPLQLNGSLLPDVSITINIPVPPNSLFELVSNLDYRMHWTNGINQLKYKKDRINRAGTQHVCVLDTGSINIESFADRSIKDKLVLGEKTLDPPFADSLSTIYTVTKDESGEGSNLTLESSIEGKGFLHKITKPFFLMKFKKVLNKTVHSIAENASQLIDDLKID